MVNLNRWGSLFFAVILFFLVVNPSVSSPELSINVSSFGRIQYNSESRALNFSKMFGWSHGSGAYTYVGGMYQYVPTIEEKRNLLDYWSPCQSVIVDFQKAEYLGSQRSYVIKHLNEWVEAAKEKGVVVFIRAWTGIDHNSGWMFSEPAPVYISEQTKLEITDFWIDVAQQFRGKDNVILGPIWEDVFLPNQPYPYEHLSDPDFQEAWRSMCTRVVRGIHSVDSNIPVCLPPVSDLGAGLFTLGSKAWYPNAWEPLDEPNVIYRVCWVPKNNIKSSSLYPFDDASWIKDHSGSGLLEGAINFHKETGLPIMIEVLVEWREVGGKWIWDDSAMQWIKDLVPEMKEHGVGISNFGVYYESSNIAYGSHDESGEPKPWVEIYKNAVREVLTIN